MIRQLLRNRVFSNALADIEQSVANVLESLQAFLRGMDWSGPERNTREERWSYKSILDEIEQFHDDERIRDPIDHSLVEALGKTFEAGTCVVYSGSNFRAPNFVPAVQASENSLPVFLENPCLGSPHLQRHVEWELDNVILPHLYIIVPTPKNRAVSNTLTDSRRIVVNTLSSVQTFLLEMDWNSPEGDLLQESSCFESIVEEVAQIRDNERTRDLINTALVEALASVFSRLINENDWEHTTSTDSHVQKCRDILVSLRSTDRISSSS